MNELAQQVLGVSIFSFKARDAIRQAHGGECGHGLGVCGWIQPVQPMAAKSFEPKVKRAIFDIYDPCIDDDDETASTMSTADDDSCCSDDIRTVGSNECGDRKPVVSFDTPLVSAVYVRPYTTLSEKRLLYYTDVEYRMFRRDYVYRPARDRVVQFGPTLVTATYSIPLVVDTTDLYYSEAELQGFLDDFVASLAPKT